MNPILHAQAHWSFSHALLVLLLLFGSAVAGGLANVAWAQYRRRNRP